MLAFQKVIRALLSNYWANITVVLSILYTKLSITPWKVEDLLQDGLSQNLSVRANYEPRAPLAA